MALTRRRWFALVALTAVFVATVSTGVPSAHGGVTPSFSMPPDPAVDDDGSTDEDVILDVAAPGVLANDFTLPTSCVALVEESPVASVGLQPDGAYGFKPARDFNGETTFTYGLMLVGDESCPGPYDDVATVRITVNAVNDPPTAVADSFQFVWGQTLTIPGPGVLANDSDVDGNPLSAIVATNPAHGVLTLAANGGFSYTPAAAACPGVADAFSYRASDGTATSAARAVILNPAAVPCPTPVPSPSPSPVPSASPEPSPSPTPEPSPSPSAEPSATIDPFASPSLDVPTALPTIAPSPTASPGPTNGGGGLPLPVLLVAVLLGVLLAFGVAYYVPRWIEARRTGGEPPEL